MDRKVSMGIRLISRHIKRWLPPWKEPIISQKSMAYNFTNEGGVCDTFRLLKNIMGLWLVQESRRTWEREGRSSTTCARWFPGSR